MSSGGSSSTETQLLKEILEFFHLKVGTPSPFKFIFNDIYSLTE